MQAALKKCSFSLASLRECQSRCSTCQKLQWRWSLASIRCRTVPSTPSLCLSDMQKKSIDFCSDGIFWERRGINSNWKIWRSVLRKLHVTFHELSESIERCWWMGELSPERDEIALKRWLKPSSSSYSSLECVFLMDFFIVHFSIFKDLSYQYSNFFMLSNKRKSAKFKKCLGNWYFNNLKSCETRVDSKASLVQLTWR